MRYVRIHAVVATLLAASVLAAAPASAAVANDEYNTATQILGMPVVLSADAANAMTSVTNGRPGCYRDMWYRLPSIASSSVRTRVTGGSAYIVPSVLASEWDTITIGSYVAVPADGNVSRWANGSYLVLCRNDDTAGSIGISLDGQLIAPSPVTAISGNQAFTVTWGAGSNGESLLSAYRLDYRLVGAVNWISRETVTSSTRTYTVTGLTNGAQYEYRVWAVSAYGSSAAVGAQTIWVGKPVAVAALTARASYRAVIVDWAGSVETSVVKGVYLTLSCVGMAPITYQSTGPIAGSRAFVGLAPGTVCSATGKWLGLYGFDAAASASTAQVTVLDYASPTTVGLLRESGASIVRWVMPTVTLPTGTTLVSHRVSVQCSSPTWSIAAAEVAASTTQYANAGMALGATCIASVYSIYRDGLGNLGQSKPTISAAVRLMEAPAPPSVGTWKPSGTSMAFPLALPTSTGREPETVTVTEYRAGAKISTTVLTATTGWTYLLPVTEAVMNSAETFTAVASNAAGASTALTWSVRVPSLPETLTASLFTATFRADVLGPRHIDLTVIKTADRPWMRDLTAKYVVTVRNQVTDATRVIEVPVTTATTIPDVGHFIPSMRVQVALVTEMGTSAPLDLVGGAPGPKPIARASVTRTAANSARLTWASVAAGGQLRVEVYRGKSFTRLLSVSRSTGALNVTGLKAKTLYTFAMYTFDGTAFSAKPLLLRLRTS